MKDTNLPKGALRLDSGEQATIIFEESEGQPKRPKIRMVGYSGEVIKDHWYWGNLGIDLNGMRFPKGRYPLLQQHDIDIRLAHMGKPVVINNKLLAPEDDVVFLDNEHSQRFLKESSEGFPFQASIYAKPLKVIRLDDDQEHECNGCMVKGPGAVWLESEFKEMSVCVFGADSNTSAVAFKGDEPCSFAEVTFADTMSAQTKGKEVKVMDKEQLKKDHPDLYAEIFAEAKAQFSQPDPEIASLKATVARLGDENKELKKESDLRREKEIKLEAKGIWTEKLAASELPDRLHDKVRAMVDYNKFVVNQELDVEVFKKAIDVEIADWLSRGVKKGDVVLGESTSVRTEAASAKVEENQKLTNRLLAHAGQIRP